MRIVVTLATLLALPYGILAGDDVPGLSEGAIVPAAAAQAECDTSVYHLEHAHARQLIGRVKSLVAQIAAYSADDNVGALPKSLVLMPTSSDDTIIVICPRAHAGLVKHAIKSCDSLKQYAVKVQLFEVADSGKTIPVGGPHLLIGRDGTVQCATPDESVSVTFKVDTPLVDANTEFAPCPGDDETTASLSSQASAACGAGRCRLDCAPPIGEMAVESECGSCSESCSGTCPACKTGTCTGDCCKAGCCHGQATGCEANGCKCDGSCCTTGLCAQGANVVAGVVGAVGAPDNDTTEEIIKKVVETIDAKRVCSVEKFGPRGFVLTVQPPGQCAASCTRSSGTCAACKTGTCTGDCCKGGCCHGQAAGCEANGCKCDGSCCAKGQCTGRLHDAASYEEACTECPACHSSHRFSVGFGFGAGGPGMHFVGPIVWFNKGDEPRCAGCEAHEFADSDEGHEGEVSNLVPPAPAAVELDSRELPCHATLQQIEKILHERLRLAPGSDINVEIEVPSRTKRTIAYDYILNPGDLCDPAKLAKSKGTLTGAKVFNVGEAGICIEQCRSADPAGSSCTDGCPLLAKSTEEAASSPIAPCCCEEREDAQQAPGAEPPALLTLVQHKDPSSALSAPHWQEELLKAFHGRRLSELFEPQATQTPSGHELGRLLAEFPKSGAAHSLTIVDTPVRVQIFQSDASAFEPVKLPETAKTPAFNTCPNCREEFRAFLEEMFRGSEATEDIAQTSHHEGDHKASEAARDLPNITHSKIAAETHSYPLRDLVLCDDEGRPVFDTCTIIDHLQSAVAPESWSHPSVSIQLDQQSVSLVVTQTAEVHQKIADHLRYLRRLQIKQICNLIERLSGDTDDAAEPTTQTEMSTPSSDVELGPALHVGGK